MSPTQQLGEVARYAKTNRVGVIHSADVPTALFDSRRLLQPEEFLFELYNFALVLIELLAAAGPVLLCSCRCLPVEDCAQV
jgi:hypothetical protein